MLNEARGLYSRLGVEKLKKDNSPGRICMTDGNALQHQIRHPLRQCPPSTYSQSRWGLCALNQILRISGSTPLSFVHRQQIWPRPAKGANTSNLQRRFARRRARAFWLGSGGCRSPDAPRCVGHTDKSKENESDYYIGVIVRWSLGADCAFLSRCARTSGRQQYTQWHSVPDSISLRKAAAMPSPRNMQRLSKSVLLRLSCRATIKTPCDCIGSQKDHKTYNQSSFSTVNEC